MLHTGRLAKVGRGLKRAGGVVAWVGGLGLDALKFTVAAEGGEEMEDCGVDIHSIFRT